MGFLGHVDELHAKGVVGVINMCGEYRGPVEDYNRLGVEQLWLPTVVRCEQPQRVVVEFPSRIRAQIGREQAVLPARLTDPA